MDDFEKFVFNKFFNFDIALRTSSIKQIKNYSELNKIEKIPSKMVFFQSSMHKKI